MSALCSEALVVRGACLLSLSRNWFEASIFSDNLSMILLSVYEDAPPWEVHVIFLDIRSLRARLILSLSFLRWSQNPVAHEVAKLVAHPSLPTHWVFNSVVSIRKALIFVLYISPCLVVCFAILFFLWSKIKGQKISKFKYYNISIWSAKILR